MCQAQLHCDYLVEVYCEELYTEYEASSLFEHTEQAKHAATDEGDIVAADDHDIMEQILGHLGGMGCYQRWLFLIMMPIMFMHAFVYGVQMFVAATPQQHWCKVPELMHLDVDLRRNLSIPGAVSGKNWDQCFMFDANWTQVLANMTPPGPNSLKVPCKNGWEFLYYDIPYSTVVSEREWVCDKASYAPWAQSIFFVGSLIGSLFFGWVGDKFGRVPTLIASNLFGCVGGIATAFTTGFWDFSFCRFLTGFSYDTGYMIMYILVLEYVGPKHRSWVGNISLALFSGIGGAILPALAYWFKDWKLLLIVTSVPMVLIVGAQWGVPESARWLSSVGRVDEAIKTLKKFERINKAKIPDEIMQKFITSTHKKKKSDESMLGLLRNAPNRNSLLIVVVSNVIAYLVLDTVVRLSDNIGPNLFITYALSSLIEIPSLSVVAVILDWMGRRLITLLTMSIAGALSFVCTLVPLGTPQLILALLVRLFVNMSVAVLGQLGVEVLPTGLRALGSSIIHMSMFVTITCSAFIVYSRKLWIHLPLVIIGALGVLGTCLALLLPETKGRPMPQTIADAETLILETQLFRKRKKNDQE